MAALNHYIGNKLGPTPRNRAGVAGRGKPVAAAVAIASTVAVTSLFILPPSVMRSGRGRRLLVAVICDILAVVSALSKGSTAKRNGLRYSRRGFVDRRDLMCIECGRIDSSCDKLPNNRGGLARSTGQHERRCRKA